VRCCRLARCLYELQWVQEASDCMQAFKSKFPDHVHSHACKALVKDIETASASKPDVGKPRVWWSAHVPCIYMYKRPNITVVWLALQLWVGKALVRILAQSPTVVFCASPQALQAEPKIAPQIRPQLLPSTSFQCIIHQLLYRSKLHSLNYELH
jgi:hypothetical protein